MRILILNHEFPPVGTGASAGTRALANGYAARGHDVSVVTMAVGGLPAYEYRDGVRLYRLAPARRRKERCTVAEMARFIVSARRFLSKHLCARSYDVAHAQFIVPSGLVARWAKQRYGLRYIVTSRGSDVLGHNPRFRFLYPLVAGPWSIVLREAAVVACATRFLAQRIQHLQSDVRPVVVPNAVDPAAFRPLPKDNRILVVGRLIPLKGVDDILDALARLNLDGWRVDIVGEGTSRPALERRARRHGLAPSVTFHGWIDHDSDALRHMFGTARIFVLASHRENMSVSLLEAIAAGCRIIASSVGGTPEVVGLDSLFEPHDVAALAGKIACAMADGRDLAPPPLSGDLQWELVVPQYEALCRQSMGEIDPATVSLALG